VFVLDTTIGLGDILSSMAFVGAVGVACRKALLWQATLSATVADGFQKNNERHREIREELRQTRTILVEHGHHLASLDERTALLLRSQHLDPLE